MCSVMCCDQYISQHGRNDSLCYMLKSHVNFHPMSKMMSDYANNYLLLLLFMQFCLCSDNQTDCVFQVYLHNHTKTLS